MPPRPHLAFRGRFDLRASLGGADLGEGLGRGAGASCSGADEAARPPGPAKGRMLLSAIVAGEVAVVLAVGFVVVVGPTDPRQSSWALLAASVSIPALSCLRRRAFPGGAED